MISFINFALDGRSVDITIPMSSLVYFNKDFSIIKKNYRGEILYENFPIAKAEKSFFKNIYTEINFGTMLSKYLTIENNLKKYAKIYDSRIIWDLPLKYFEISEELWKLKPHKVSNLIQMQIELGILLLCRKTICLLKNFPEIEDEFTQNKLKNIIFSKISYGKEIVMYTGKKSLFEDEIKIFL